MARELDVYLREVKIGILEQDDSADLVFTYNEDYVESKSAAAISVAMPITTTTYPNAIAKPYFSGLLPDESARSRLAAALGVSESNTFGMLEIIGGECAGALALVPREAGVPIQNLPDEILNEQQLADLLQQLRGNPLLGSRADVRLSLAGAQDKVAVRVLDDQVVLVKNGDPTTHILKPSIDGLLGTAQNETFCMTLAARVGLSVPEVWFSTAGDTAYMLVERFDRICQHDNTIMRLHQEDFCQALSVPPELKYEDEGGPGIEQSTALIQRVVDQPAADTLVFLRMLIYNYLIGNADAHAKNYALLYSLNSRSPTLAPLYDALCTAVYPELTKNMAMRIGGKNRPDTVQLKHWLSLVPGTKAGQQVLMMELKKLSELILLETEKLLLEARKQGYWHPVLNTINNVIQTRANGILNEIQ